VPFCTQCGQQVATQALYCPNCGSPQGGARRPAATADPFSTISDRTASLLCYIPVLGVIPAIVFLAIQRYRSNARVRFDAFQSLYLFVTFLVVSSVLPPFFALSFGHLGFHHFFVGILKLAIFLIWIYLLVKAAQQERIHLPVIGDLAAKSAAEQL
jgi:uncharacterized membrane protein